MRTRNSSRWSRASVAFWSTDTAENEVEATGDAYTRALDAWYALTGPHDVDKEACAPFEGWERKYYGGRAYDEAVNKAEFAREFHSYFA